MPSAATTVGLAVLAAANKKLAKDKDAGSGTGGLETNRNDNHSQKFG
jgi:hypothetical protein